ncbi:MAG TPA: hypothetical protein VLV31_10330 [Candidatus Acidoferrales bacterium]|nr:hypothetical protein [Candidatus Acidoferrales bacterium]
MTQASSTLVVQDFVKVDNLLQNEYSASQRAALTFGIETLDNALCLNFGQFLVFRGKTVHSLCTLLCVRATLPCPLGPDCNVLFVDGGNSFDPYAISDISVTQNLDGEYVLERFHVSRAFTHHQLACIITDKLSSAIRKFDAKLVVVSDITCLYCDPDVRDDDKEDAVRIFTKTVQALRALARQHHCLIITTSLKPRNSMMDSILERVAHVSINIEQRDGLAIASLKRQNFPPSTITFASHHQTLERFM